MANKSISQLTAGGAVSGTDLFPDVQTAGVGPVKVTATQLATFFWYQPTLVNPALGAATATSINIGGATLGSNVLATNGTTLLGGATTVSTGGLTIGVQQTTQGSLVLANTAAGSFATTIQSSNSASAAWTLTLPTTAGSSGYLLTTNGSGVTSWTNPTALGIDLDVGTTAITNGTVGRLLFEGAGNVLQESANLTFSTAALTLGVQQTTQGSLVLANTAAGAYGVTLVSSNSATAGWTMTLPVAAPAGNSYVLTSTTAGVTSWSNPTALGIDLDVGTTAITGGTTTRVLYDNGGVLGEASSLTITASTNKVGVISAPFGLSGNISSTAWTTSGIRYQNVAATLTDTSSSGTVANAYTDFFGANTIAASNSTTFTNYYTMYIGSPTAGTNVTITNAYSLGTAGNVNFGGSLAVSTTLTFGTSATGPLVIGGTGTTSTLTLQSTSGVGTTGADILFKAGNNGATEIMRATNAGNLLVGGTAARGTTVGVAHISIFNGTAPAGTLTNGISLYSSSGDFNFMDSSGNGYKVGFRNVPPVGTKTGSYSLATADVGKYVQVSTGGAITIPDATFAEGDIISIFNNTTGNITITCSITTAYIAGTDTDKATMTLATRGVATVLFISSTVCVVSGNVS